MPLMFTFFLVTRLFTHMAMTVPCGVCEENLAKYKCSTCYCPFCSLNCWKKHKNETTCKKKDEKKSFGENNNEYNGKKKYFTEDTVSEEKLRQLGESEVLRKLLNNKYLQATLVELENASKPEEALKQAMRDPDFVNFVDECLKIVEDSKD